MSLIATTSWPLLVWSGFAAWVFSSWLLMLLRSLGATRYLPRAYWSCALFGGVSDPALIAGGLLRTVAMITLFPVIYSAVFVWNAHAEVLIGAIAGTVHGFVAGLLLPLAARRCAGAQSPGLFGWNLGRATPLVLLAHHALYGAALGYIYVVASP